MALSVESYLYHLLMLHSIVYDYWIVFDYKSSRNKFVLQLIKKCRVRILICMHALENAMGEYITKRIQK